MQVQTQTQQIAEEELLLSLSEDELDNITGGLDVGPIAEPLGRAVGAVAGGAMGAGVGFLIGGPPGAAIGAGIGVVGGQELGGLEYRLAGKGLSAIHNSEGHWWSFL